MAKKKMTIEDLAILTQKGFLEVGVNILGVKTELKGDIAAVKAELKADIAQINDRVSRLENQMRELVGHIDALMSFMKKEEQERLFLIAKVRRLEERVAKLEAKKK